VTEGDDLAGAALEVVSGPEPGRKLALDKATTTLGRAPGNTHVVADTTISRQHAKVFVRDGRHWIADLNSSHGTFVNGVKVTLQTLTDGDEVKLGTTVLRYVAGAAKKVAAPPPGPPAAPASAPKPSAGPPAVAPAPKSAESRTGAFELEFADGEASSPASRGPLPPLATGYRRALAPSGEDPFADVPAETKSEPEPAPRARDLGGGSIELRGETARQFAARGSSAPPSTAAPAAGRAAHAPPPLAQVARKRGPFTFLRDELDQRGPLARMIAALFALAVAAGLCWLALRAFAFAPKSDATPAQEEGAPQGPSRPVLPTRK
jgi:predicted component of type VI protein secretion system